MKVVKIEVFKTPSGAMFEKEEDAVNEMLNHASQIVAAAGASHRLHGPVGHPQGVLHQIPAHGITIASGLRCGVWPLGCGGHGIFSVTMKGLTSRMSATNSSRSFSDTKYRQRGSVSFKEGSAARPVSDTTKATRSSTGEPCLSIAFRVNLSLNCLQRARRSLITWPSTLAAALLQAPPGTGAAANRARVPKLLPVFGQPRAPSRSAHLRHRQLASVLARARRLWRSAGKQEPAALPAFQHQNRLPSGILSTR